MTAVTAASSTTGSCAPSAPPPGRAGRDLVLVPPADPRGPAVRAFARQFTRAVRTSAVRIDDAPCSQWSAGQRLWLVRLVQIAEDCQRRRAGHAAPPPTPGAPRVPSPRAQSPRPGVRAGA